MICPPRGILPLPTYAFLHREVKYAAKSEHLRGGYDGAPKTQPSGERSAHAAAQRRRPRRAGCVHHREHAARALARQALLGEKRQRRRRVPGGMRGAHQGDRRLRPFLQRQIFDVRGAHDPGGDQAVSAGRQFAARLAVHPRQGVPNLKGAGKPRRAQRGGDHRSDRPRDAGVRTGGRLRARRHFRSRLAIRACLQQGGGYAAARRSAL